MMINDNHNGRDADGDD